MKLEAVEIRRLRLPLKAPFVTSFGSQEHRDMVLLRCVTDVGDGWGECVALAEPVYSAEYLDGAAEVLRRFLAPALFAAGDTSPERVAGLLEHVVGHRMAKAALESALLDASLRGRSQSFADYLGVARTSVPSGVSVGIAPSLPELLETVAGFVDDGYVRIKLKIKPGWDVEVVRAVRERFGDALPLQVDANSAYTLADADTLRGLDEFGLLLIEQPLYEDDLRLHAKLAEMVATPICLDESIVSARAAADAIALGAARILNIKPGRVGGYLEARRIHDLAVANGVAVWCGGMLETGIGRAANAALAAMPGFTLPGDVSASDRFYAEDLTEPIVLREGRIDVPTAPGLGGTPIPERLEALTVHSEWVRP